MTRLLLSLLSPRLKKIENGLRYNTVIGKKIRMLECMLMDKFLAVAGQREIE
jgi:hypothetical protein